MTHRNLNIHLFHIQRSLVNVSVNITVSISSDFKIANGQLQWSVSEVSTVTEQRAPSGNYLQLTTASVNTARQNMTQCRSFILKINNEMYL